MKSPIRTLSCPDRRWLGMLAVLALAVTVEAGAAPAIDGCGGRASCAETKSFVAEVTNWRTSRQGKLRLATATVRFRNRTKQPLAFGYVAGSGVATDELGNRYIVPAAGGVRALGVVDGAVFDAKFLLGPAEESDARLEFAWEPGKAKAGASFEVEMAIREIVPTTAEQYRLGSEHALRFVSVGAPAPAAAAGSVASAGQPVTADPCGGSRSCFNAGTFVADVVSVSPTAMTKGVRHQSVTYQLKLRNVSERPVVLAYRKRSSSGRDDFGNTFLWGRPGTHDTSAKGIGYVDDREADPQFTLAPGQARQATFTVTRYNAVPPIGQAFGWDLVIDELELLPGQQMRSVRQNSLTFAGLAPGAYAAASGAGAASLTGGSPDADSGADAVNAVSEAATAAQKIKDLFRKKN